MPTPFFGITEPATTATDIVLATVLFWWAIRLGKEPWARSPGPRLWRLAFSIVGVAAVFGALHHGLRLVLGPGPILTLQHCTAITIAIGSFACLVAALHTTLRPGSSGEPRKRALRGLLIGAGLTTVGLMVLILGLNPHPDFDRNAVYHSFQLAAFLFWRRSIDDNLQA